MLVNLTKICTFMYRYRIQAYNFPNLLLNNAAVKMVTEFNVLNAVLDADLAFEIDFRLITTSAYS